MRRCGLSLVFTLAAATAVSTTTAAPSRLPTTTRWSTRLLAGLAHPVLACRNGGALAAEQDGALTRLGASGAVVWRRLDRAAPPLAAPVEVDGGYWLLDADGVELIADASGRRQTRLELPVGRAAQLLPFGAHAALIDRERVTLLDAQGRVAQRFQLDAPWIAGAAPTIVTERSVLRVRSTGRPRRVFRPAGAITGAVAGATGWLLTVDGQPLLLRGSAAQPLAVDAALGPFTPLALLEADVAVLVAGNQLLVVDRRQELQRRVFDGAAPVAVAVARRELVLAAGNGWWWLDARRTTPTQLAGCVLPWSAVSAGAGWVGSCGGVRVLGLE